MKCLVISNGMLATIAACSTRAMLRTYGASLSIVPDKKLIAGTAAHRSFEAWSRGAAPDAAVAEFLKAYQHYSDCYLTADDIYYHENLAKILDIYFCSNPLVTMAYEVIKTEDTLTVDLGTFDNIRYLVSDRSDGQGRMKDNGSLWSVEYKTTGAYIGEDYLNNYELDSQITTHIEAMRQRGLDCAGVVLGVLKFSKLPDPNAVTKTGKPASCRVRGHGHVRDCWMTHVNSQRHLLTRTQAEIDTWRWNTTQMMHKYRRYLGLGDLALTPQEGLFGKCGQCDYLRFCKTQRMAMHLLKYPTVDAGVLRSGFYDEKQLNEMGVI